MVDMKLTKKTKVAECWIKKIVLKTKLHKKKK